MIDILYRDEILIIADKPAGLPVHATKDLNRKNFTNMLEEEVCIKPLRTVNRLDLDTSGLVVLGIDSNQNKLIDSIMNTSIKKYICIVHGKIEKNGRIESFLKDGNKMVKTVRSGGKKAITEFERIDYDSKKNLSLLELNLITGRRHQIRIHLFELGFPILGEKIYTNRTPQEKRSLLHSYSIQFENYKKEIVTVNSKIPSDFKNYFSL
jgi:23S rRNA pseudouridine1911/1915/1917 synthase